MATHIFELRASGQQCLTRGQAEKVRVLLVQCHTNMELGDTLAIDFDGIDVMTPSFADECFAKFAEHVGFQNFRTVVSLRGGSETLRILVNSVLSRRQQGASST